MLYREGIFLFKNGLSKYGHIISGLIIGIAVTGAMLLLAAVLMYYANVEQSLASPLSSVCLAVGCFFGGFAAGKKKKSKGLLCGITVSGIYFFLLVLTSLCISFDGFSALTAIHVVVMLLAGGMGGICGVNTKSKPLI